MGRDKIPQGLLGVAPCLCVAAPPCPDSPKDVATLSLKVLKDSESAARPVGRYLLHANAIVCLVLLPQLLCGAFASCGILCRPPDPHPPMRGSGLGQQSLPR